MAHPSAQKASASVCRSLAACSINCRQSAVVARSVLSSARVREPDCVVFLFGTNATARGPVSTRHTSRFCRGRVGIILKKRGEKGAECMATIKEKTTPTATKERLRGGRCARGLKWEKRWKRTHGACASPKATPPRRPSHTRGRRPIPALRALGSVAHALLRGR